MIFNCAAVVVVFVIDAATRFLVVNVTTKNVFVIFVFSLAAVIFIVISIVINFKVVINITPIIIFCCRLFRRGIVLSVIRRFSFETITSSASTL